MLEGKGFYIWILTECEGGDPLAIRDRALEAGLSHVLIKIADGVHPFNLGRDVPVTQALHNAGVQVWGWHYVYGNQPEAEADIAIRRVLELGLDGYVIDAEIEYKNRPGQARRFARRLRDGLPDTPLALSSYRFPDWHPELPWNEFLEVCDLHMPQVYWEQAHNVAWQLAESKRQCDRLAEARPYVPTGAAYATGGWAATPQDVTTFFSEARRLGVQAANLYSWDYARRHLPQVWQAATAFDWPVQPAEPLVQPPAESGNTVHERWLERLRRRDVDGIVSLYAKEAALVEGARTWRGRGISAALQRLLRRLPDDADLVMLDHSADGMLQRLHWQARKADGRILHEAWETFVVQAGQIQLHYMFYDGVLPGDGEHPVPM